MGFQGLRQQGYHGRVVWRVGHGLHWKGLQPYRQERRRSSDLGGIRIVGQIVLTSASITNQSRMAK